MKLTIEVELQADEIPAATELLTILQQLSQNVTVKTIAASLPLPNAKPVLTALISKLEDSTKLDAITQEINTALSPTIASDFFDAFVEVIFNPALVARNKSVIPFLYILPRLPEQVKNTLRDNLINKVINFLVVKRTIDCNRLEFFAYAEAFAALVKMEFVSVTGAITTITTLLKSPDTRCAAITMLGKTVELCLTLLNEKCDPSKLNELRITLQTVTEEIFRYDLNYIDQNMGWKKPAKTNVDAAVLTANLNPIKPPDSIIRSGSQSSLRSSANDISLTSAISATPITRSISPTMQQKSAFTPSPPPAVVPVALTGSLVAGNSFVGHTGTIFAICYDEVRDQLMSSGKDGFLVAWSKDGKQTQRISIPHHYACSLDMNTRHKSLFVCGVPKDANSTQSGILQYTLSDKGLWELAGVLQRDNVKLASCVKVIPEFQNNIFVTGEQLKGTDGDKHRVRVYDAYSAHISKLQPLVSYEEHNDIITSLAAYPNSEGLFFSGSRDCTIKLWDRRQAKSVGNFGVFQPTVSKVTAHDSMITCLDAYDNILVSAGLDKKLAVWDIRALDSNGLTQPLMKLVVDDQAILKVAIGPTTNYVATSTLRGLFLVDFSAGTPKAAQPPKEKKPPGRYHDLKWNGNRTILYAAGDDMRVDQYNVR